ncbi:hypothetical protein FQZ97_939750 [compost metagenome]
MPSRQGTKIIAAGHTRARYTASWPAPLITFIHVMPWSCAASRTADTSAGVNGCGGKYTTCSAVASTLPLVAMRCTASFSAASMADSTTSSAARRSTLSFTRPGITLREFG